MNEEEFLQGDGGAEQEAQAGLEDELKMLRAFWKWSEDEDKARFLCDYNEECQDE